MLCYSLTLNNTYCSVSIRLSSTMLLLLMVKNVSPYLLRIGCSL
nr:MAG TPA: hypothetical protein [Caudoviricetes sp.]